MAEKKASTGISNRTLGKIRAEAMDFAGIGFFRYRFDGTVTCIDRNAIHILGLEERYPDPEDVVGRNVEELTQYTGPKGRLRKAVREHGKVKGMEYQFKTLDGQTRWVLHDSFVVKQHNAPDEIQAIIRDITDGKQIEIELRESELRYRRIVETAEEGIWVVDDAGSTVLVNAKMADMLRCKASEIIGRSLLSFMTPEHRGTGEEFLHHSRQGHRRERELCLRRQDNSRLWTITSQSPIFNGEGTYSGTLLMVTDITERKDYELALAHEKESLAMTLRSIADGVITTDSAGRITLLNPVAEELTGWSENQAVGKQLYEVFKVFEPITGQPTAHVYERALEDGHTVGPFELEELVGKDSTRRMIADSAGAIRDDNDDIIGIIIVFRDVTQKKQVELERQKAAKLESLGRMAGGIAHDFNNILTGVTGNISLAKALLDSESEEAKLLNDAEEQAMRATDLTQQLLTFSRGGSPARKNADIAETVRTNAVFALHGAKSNVHIEIPSDLWRADADLSQVSQLVHHLVRNADQAMAQGGTVYVRLENHHNEAQDALEGLSPGDYVRLQIKDTGPGIPEQELDRLFDPYYSSDPQRTGLGLAIAYSIVQKHDGAIRIHSTPGAGTTVEVCLPAVKDEAPEDLTATPEKETAPTAEGGRILVLDDEPALRKLAVRALTPQGYAVETAADGEEALKLFKNAREEDDPFDLLILDLTIPGGMGGEEAVEKLRQIDTDVPILASSGYANAPVIADCRKYGFNDVLAKPFKIEELRQKVQQWACRHG